MLKAADEPAVNLAIKQLAAAGIPVVTLVTDLPHSERIGYVGTKRYVNCSITSTVTAATIVSVVVIKGRPSRQPVAT